MGKKKEEVVEVQDELVPQDASTETPTKELVVEEVKEEVVVPQVVTLAQKNKCRQ
jgi:hypothetical protein